jgi:hypothetical protein
MLGRGRLACKRLSAGYTLEVLSLRIVLLPLACRQLLVLSELSVKSELLFSWTPSTFFFGLPWITNHGFCLPLEQRNERE